MHETPSVGSWEGLLTEAQVPCSRSRSDVYSDERCGERLSGTAVANQWSVRGERLM